MMAYRKRSQRAPIIAGGSLLTFLVSLNCVLTLKMVAASFVFTNSPRAKLNLLDYFDPQYRDNLKTSFLGMPAGTSSDALPSLDRDFQEPPVQDKQDLGTQVTLSTWSDWAACDSTNRQSRRRVCFGTGCGGVEVTQTKPCELVSWLEWGEWSSCIQNTRTRIRLCANYPCEGSTTETAACNEDRSTIAYPPGSSLEWSGWSSWSACEYNTQRRYRTCPNAGNCLGSPTETRQCGSQYGPPETSEWMTWNQWSVCTLGNQIRTRTCSGSARCAGLAYEARICTQPAERQMDSTWGEWSPCTGFTQFRFQRCAGVDGPCPDGGYQSRGCSPSLFTTDSWSRQAYQGSSWSNWSSWSSCNLGFRQRTRTCLGQYCNGRAAETTTCYVRFVPGEGPGSVSDGFMGGNSGGGWGEWGSWSPICQYRKRWRYRSCQLDPVNIGQCVGPNAESQPC